MRGTTFRLSVAASGLLTFLLLTDKASAEERLAEAARQHNAQAVRALLQNRAQTHLDVNEALGDGTTALHWAAFNDDMEMVTALLKAGANPKATTRLGGTTPLSLACVNGNAAIINALLKAGAEVDAATTNGVTPLMTAASAGQAGVINALLDGGANINARESVHGQTALMFAAAKNRPDAIRALIRRGADWKLASTVEKLESLRFDDDGNPLRDRPAPVASSSQTAGAAVPQTAEGASPQTANASGERAGRGSGRRGRRGAAAGEAGRSPEAASRPGESAALPASSEITGQRAAANPAAAVLLARRASAVVLGGNTALTLAARDGRMEAVLALLESGADINQPSAGDHTSPLVIAICNGHYDVAKALLDHGADPNLASVDGLAALYAVIDTQWAPVGWAPNPITDQEKITYLDLMRALLDKGAQSNARLTKKLWFRPTHHDECWIGSAGATPFWRAAQATDLQAMRLLIAHNADPKIATNEGDNALMAAAGLGWNGNFSTQAPDSALDAVKYCLELGLDPKPQDVQGYTALAGAAYRGDNELVQLLVSKGAKLDTRNTRGWSLTDMANGPSLRSSVPVAHPYTVALLLKLGAPALTPLDGEEILGIIRKRPAPASSPAETAAKTSAVPTGDADKTKKETAPEKTDK